jgi:Protein of unknown function (DUF3105)
VSRGGLREAKPLKNLSRRTLLIVNVVLATLTVALIGVALAMRGDADEPAGLPAARVPDEQQAPAPLVTKIRRHSPVGRFETATCQDQRYSVKDPARWFHPTDNFYPPGADAPTRADLDHLANNDGAVVVTYRQDATHAARRALQRWAATGIGVVVAPATSKNAPQLEAYTSDRRLTCDGVDLDQLTTFTDRHFSKPIPYNSHGTRSG